MRGFKKVLIEVIGTTVPVSILLLVLAVGLGCSSVVEIASLIICAVMIVFGFTLFLVGVDIGIMPMGIAIGGEIPRRKSMLFLILTVFIISFAITLAEPDVMVFCDQVGAMFGNIDGNVLIVAIALGVAAELVLAALRIIYKISLRALLTLGYAVVILLAIFSPDEFMGIAFDSGGVTTGPMTVPVLMAFGMGICYASSSHSKMESFGIIGLASIGPIIVLLTYGLLMDPTSNNTVSQISEILPPPGIDLFLYELKETCYSVLISVGLIFIIFAIFQKFFLHYSWRDFRIMSIGIIISMIGMVLFLTGVFTGFMPVAEKIGASIAENGNGALALIIGLVMGFLVARAEPAVKILANQAETNSENMLPSKTVTNIIAIGVSLFVGVGFYLLSQSSMSTYYILPVYAIAIVLIWFMDKDIVGIAYDAGGVATGPMSVATIMTLYAGMSGALYAETESVINGFGVISLIALAPIITMTILGIRVKHLKKKVARAKEE